MAIAFRLVDSPNWMVPHAVLAALGELSATERARLLGNEAVRLSPATHARSLWALSTLAGRSRPPGRSALANSATRVLADPSGVWLRGLGRDRTLVKRVARKATVRVEIDVATNESRTERGTNILLDHEFIPYGPGLLGGFRLSTPDALRHLDQHYRFYWSQERQIEIVPSLGLDSPLGSFLLRRPERQSATAVPLKDVPGIFQP